MHCNKWTVFRSRVIGKTPNVYLDGVFPMTLKLENVHQHYCVYVAGNSTECVDYESSSSAGYMAAFVMAHIFLSVGGSAVYTLAVPLLDDNVKRSDAPYYLGKEIHNTYIYM